MAVFRVERNRGYTVMSNHHLRNRDLTLKAKGLLSQMLSLPDNWDYTLAGLSSINREKIDAIREAVRELEKAGYIVRSRERDKKGRLRGADYIIYEQPQPPVSDLPTLENPTLDNPTLEKPMLENPTLENPTQLNKDISRTDLSKKEKSNTDISNTHYILNVTLTNRPISSFVSELLTPEQLEMYHVYLQTSGNKPLVFGGGSADTSASEDLSGVTFVNGTRPGNTVLVDIAKSQVGNVGGAPYWSWYGFDSRVAWCACFVSWCYGQAGLSEPRFAGCQSQGVPWFTSHGQWGARGYENIAPGDAIFFDWDLDGSADHVGIVIGTDGSRVYTVEGNSGDACKIRSYPLDYACIKGYGLMNWN